MNDIITREEAIDRLQSIKSKVSLYKDVIALRMAEEALKNQRIGHWERKHNSYTLEHWYKCSECGDCSDYKTPYCQWCGAKMKGK